MKASEREIEAANPMIAEAMANGEDTSGLCTMREWASSLLEHKICGEHAGEIRIPVDGKVIHMETVITRIDGKKVGRQWRPPVRYRIDALFAPVRRWWIRRWL